VHKHHQLLQARDLRDQLEPPSAPAGGRSHQPTSSSRYNSPGFTDGPSSSLSPQGDHAASSGSLLCRLAKARSYLLQTASSDGREADRIGLGSQVHAPTTDADRAANAPRPCRRPRQCHRRHKRTLNHCSPAAPIFRVVSGHGAARVFGDDAG